MSSGRVGQLCGLSSPPAKPSDTVGFQPGLGYSDAGLGYRDPGLGYRDPALGCRDPGLGYRDPGIRV